MRQIKFRGIDKVTGRAVYGAYVPFLGDDALPMIEEPKNRGSMTPIKEGSLSQLVGTDRKGREVYEGDKLRNPIDDTTFSAAMNHICTVKVYELVEATA